MNYFSLYVDGTQIPTNPLQSDYSSTHKNYISSYQTIFSGTGVHFLIENYHISPGNYSYGYCLIAFDFTPSMAANMKRHWNLIENGCLPIEIRVEEALQETVNYIVYAEFDNSIEINKTRNVITDYGSNTQENICQLTLT